MHQGRKRGSTAKSPIGIKVRKGEGVLFVMIVKPLLERGRIQKPKDKYATYSYAWKNALKTTIPAQAPDFSFSVFVHDCVSLSYPTLSAVCTSKLFCVHKFVFVKLSCYHLCACEN
jgi:hypothetical protein